jgi:SNF2 family DNA or RNA helicase
MNEINLTADADAVIVQGGPDLFSDRSLRLFFISILGAAQIEGGWRCPRRKHTIPSLVLRINSFLQSKGYGVKCDAVADDTVQREIERRRSFTRARDAAMELRVGNASIEISDVLRKLQEFGWNSEARSLFSHQQAGVVHGLTGVNTGNFSVPGAGKTATSLAIAAVRLANDDIDCILVVGPLSCFGPWEKESAAALGSVLKVERVRGASASRRSLYATARTRTLLLLGYSTAAIDKDHIIELCRRMRVMLIVDESHRIKRFRGGLWAPALMDIAKYARVKLTLSGTPMPQSGKDLFSQLRVLWPSGELTGPPDDFATRVDADFSLVMQDILPFVSRTPKSALGLDPYKIVHHFAELVGIQQEIYSLIEDQFRRIIQDYDSWRDKIDALKRGKPIRLLQAAANPSLLNGPESTYQLPRYTMPNPTLMQRLADYKHHEYPSKFVTAKNILEGIIADRSTGQKAVCWSNFVRNLDQFSEYIRTELGIPVFQIDGRVPASEQSSQDQSPRNADIDETREQIIDRFLSTSGPAILVTNPASTSESISLHSSCHNAIYLDRTYDCALFLQSIDRIHRLGLRPGQAVAVHVIEAVLPGNRPTIDRLVEQSLAAKEAVMRGLLEGANLAPLSESDDLLEGAQGDERDLEQLLKFLLGEQTDEHAV